ncbi:MAG: alpha-rhamnosidase, partial [Tannerella sp.]|nr:alpha-rhamnosidase [Tannerella sp.]
MNKIKVLIAAFWVGWCGTVLQAQESPVQLRCEYLSAPIGVDVPNPRLSWRLNDDRYGALQQAYRVIVGTDSTAVVSGKGGLWDTQKVTSDAMLITYAGKSIEPFTKYYWSVHVWDKDGVEKTSPVASFET